MHCGGWRVLPRRQIAQALRTRHAASVRFVVAASTVTLSIGIFVSAASLDANSTRRVQRIVANVGNVFVPPHPFKLERLRRAGARCAACGRSAATRRRTLRAPTVTGVYRVTVQGGDSAPRASESLARRS